MSATCPSCPICLCVNTERDIDERAFARCSDCGIAFQINPPRDLGKQYERDTYDEARENLAPGLSAWGRFFHDYGIAHQRFKQLAGKLPSSGKWVDFGCGNGAFLCAAADNAWQPLGIEPDWHFCSEVSAQCSLEVVTNIEFLANPKAHGPYNAISFFDVLEHLVHPGRILYRVAEGLNADGVIVIEVPDLSKHKGQLTEWRHHKPGEHLFGLNPKALDILRKRYLPSFRLVHSAEPVPGKLQQVWTR